MLHGSLHGHVPTHVLSLEKPKKPLIKKKKKEKKGEAKIEER